MKVELFQSVEEGRHCVNESSAFCIEKKPECPCELEVETTGRPSGYLVVEHGYAVFGFQRQGQNFSFAGPEVCDEGKGGGTVGCMNRSPGVLLHGGQIYTLLSAFSQFADDSRWHPHLFRQLEKDLQEAELMKILKR